VFSKSIIGTNLLHRALDENVKLIPGSARPCGLRGNIRSMDSGHRFHELADAAPVLIWRAGPDRYCNYFNVPWLKFTGRSMDSQLGEGWLEGVHPEDRERCLSTFATAFENRQEFSMDFRLKRHDGVYRWVLDTGRPFFLADGVFGGFLGSCVDITDRKEAEVNAARALADARRAIRQRDVLLAEVHHRVKNNLQVILSLMALRARHLKSNACRDELENIGRRIQAIAIIQQELHEDQDVSKIGLKDYISRVTAPLAALHRSEQIVIEVSGREISIDLTTAGIVGMIIAELVSNSFRHAFPQGSGRIGISIGLDSAGLPSITVQDSGAGFPPPEDMNNDGIGLLLARNLARQGNIRLRSEPGPHAFHELLLPAHALTPQQAEA
jgi:PAS domain S-box-containing protein